MMVLPASFNKIKHDKAGLTVRKKAFEVEFGCGGRPEHLFFNQLSQPDRRCFNKNINCFFKYILPYSKP